MLEEISFQGHQRVPDGVDLSRFRGAVAWCRRFPVGFGVAPLGEAAG